MTVKELIEELSKYPQDMEVLKKYGEIISISGYEEIEGIYQSNHEIIID